MPARTDLYFPPEDERHWSRFIERGEVRVLDTEWGHFGGLGNNEADNHDIDQHLRDLLAQPAD
jgi:homoserine O-acetyltransferase